MIETPLEQAVAFIESLTADPLLMGVDDIEMTLEDVQEHARIELESIKRSIAAAPSPLNHVVASETDLHRAVAKVIDPVSFNVTAASYGADEEGFKRSFAYGAQLVALDKAHKVISLLSQTASGGDLVISDTDRLKIPRLTAAWGGIENAPEALVDHALKAAKEAMVEGYPTFRVGTSVERTCSQIDLKG